MPRLFFGLPIPPAAAERITMIQGGIRGARWEPPEKLHLTVHFVGEVDGGTARRIIDGFADFSAPAFDLVLRGVGYFPPRNVARSLWVGAARSDALSALHRRVLARADALGLRRDRRAFTPHVTIARLRDADMREVASFVVAHATFELPPIPVRELVLYRSVLGKRGSHYRHEAAFPLAPPADPPD